MQTQMKTSLTIERLLPLLFVASAISEIGLHIAGHGTSHEVWHNWAVAHVLLSLLWLISVACHIKRHRHWYKSIVSKGMRKKSPLTLVLSAAFLTVTVTGIVLMTCVDGANSAVGQWHYKIGILLTILCIIHVCNRKRKRWSLKRYFVIIKFIILSSFLFGFPWSWPICMGPGLSGNLYGFLYVDKIKTAASCWLAAVLS